MPRQHLPDLSCTSSTRCRTGDCTRPPLWAVYCILSNIIALTVPSEPIRVTVMFAACCADFRLVLLLNSALVCCLKACLQVLAAGLLLARTQNSSQELLAFRTSSPLLST